MKPSSRTDERHLFQSMGMSLAVLSSSHSVSAAVLGGTWKILATDSEKIWK